MVSVLYADFPAVQLLSHADLLLWKYVLSAIAQQWLSLGFHVTVYYTDLFAIMR
jgi:hypothetical protein